MLHQGRGIYDELFTLSQFSRSSEYSVVDGGGASMVCLHRSIQVTCMPTLGCHVYAYLGGLPYNYGDNEARGPAKKVWHEAAPPLVRL